MAAKYKPYSRGEFGKRRVAWLKRHWKWIAGVALVSVVLLVLETVILVGLERSSPLNWYLLGVTHAAIVLGVFWMLNHAFLVADRDAMGKLRGAWGEERTRDELKRAQRDGLIWGWVDSVEVEGGDIDHLVVSREAGLLAIDSKWRSRTNPADQQRMIQDAKKVKVRAEGIARTIVKNNWGRRRAQVNPLSARAIVAIWGAVQDEMNTLVASEGIQFIAGREIRDWLAGLGGETVDQDAATDLLSKLESFRATSRGAAEHR